MSDDIYAENTADELVHFDSMADYYEAMGLDPREWDQENWVCVRRSESWSDPPTRGTYIARSNIRNLPKIEALRWKALQLRSRMWERINAVSREIIDHPDQEAFIPDTDPKGFEEFKKEKFVEFCNDRERSPTIEEFEEYFEDNYLWATKPRRLVVTNYLGCDGEEAVNYDDCFWNYKPPRHDKSVAMEVLAAAADHGDWDAKVLPKMIERASDPVKLDIGRRYAYAHKRERHLSARCHYFNDLLERAVYECKILPSGNRFVEQPVTVVINGRRYLFNVGGANGINYASKQVQHWPRPDDLDDVVVTGIIEPADTVS